MTSRAHPDHVVELRRDLVDVRAVCAALDLKPSREERGKWLCPRHGGASLSVTLGPDRTIRAKCFGCDFAGDVFNLIAEVHRLDVGRDFPRVLEEAARIARRWDLLGDARPPATVYPFRAPVYPPELEVDALWSACQPVTADAEAVALLEGRALDVTAIERLSLARALPLGGLPIWARYDGRSWASSGHRLVLPVYDAEGRMRSVRGWRVTEGSGPKRLPPVGHKAAGLVLANAAVRAMLAGAPSPAAVRLVVVEGEPDFLAWASRTADGVIGLGSGFWTAAHAAHVPDGARVIIRTHHDAAGDAYAAAVRASLHGRCVVFRSRPATEADT